MADMLDEDKMEDEEYEFGGESSSSDAESSYTPEYEDFGAQADAEANLDLDMDDQDAPEMAMDGPSPMVKKLATWGGIAVAMVALTFYLMQSEKAKINQEDGVQPEPAAVVAKIEAGKPLDLTPVQQPTPEPVIQKVVPVESISTPVPLSTLAATSISAEQVEQASRLAKQVQSNKLTLDNVQVRLESLQDSINQGMSNLQSDLKNLKVAPKPVVKKFKTVKRRPKAMMQRAPRERLSVRAIVPGRAWIGSSLGLIRTVTVGDHLPGYGKIHKIDAANGRVVMSSGTVIVYGPGDF